MAKQSLHLQHATLLIVGALLIAAITATPTHAQQPPPVPHAFYGSVEVNGKPAAVGAQIEARGAGVKVGTQGNPLSTTVAGRYGGPTLGEPKLGVQGYVTDKTPIEFYVDGIKAECARPGGPWENSYPFASGVVTQLNLRVGQNATATATPTSTPLPMAISASPTPITAANTPQPTWTTEPATPTTSAATQNAVRATRTPRSATPTPLGATGAASVTPTSQDTPAALPSATPIAAGNAAIVLASPTPTGSSASRGGVATPAQASPTPAAKNEAVATVPSSATPEPAKPEAAAAALASAAQSAETRTPVPLIARVTAGPRGASVPILGSGAVADTVPSAAPVAASSRTLSSILPWAGAGLLLLAFGLIGVVVGLRLRKSGRIRRYSEEQP